MQETSCVVPLGSSIYAALRQYARAARVTARYPNGAPSSFQVSWHDETELTGTADRSGTIVYLHLLGPVE